MVRVPLLHIVITISFLLNSVGALPYAQAQEPFLPKPGVMVSLSPEFTSAHLRGMSIHPDNALQFDFIINRGDVELSGEQKKEEYEKLIKYFLASLTTPEKDLWVNLSPYEKNKIIPDTFGKTEMGRDLLAEDYLLKQITASLIYPDSELGKKFWDKVYEQAHKQFGTTDIPVNTFNKVWIIPDEAVVYEHGHTAFILKSHLKVMLEEDYLALKQNSLKGQKVSASTLSSKIVKDIVVPLLEKEVNEGKNFANLRQVNHSLILATWFKKRLKDSILSKVYVDKGKFKGVDQDPKNNQKIYERYLEAYKKGVFNYIKEDVDQYSQEIVPRKYFSGGWGAVDLAQTVEIKLQRDLTAQDFVELAEDRLREEKFDKAGVALHIVDNAMSSNIPSRTPQEAAQILAQAKRMVLVVGAGISMEAFLPDWYSLRNALVKVLLSQLGFSESEVNSLIKILEENWKISPERTMQTLTQDLGLDVLGAMQALNAGKPVSNHVNIAKMLKQGGVDVISYNFDTLIEQAAYAEGMWRVMEFKEGDQGKINRVTIARFAQDGKSIEERKEINLDDIENGSLNSDKGIRLFFVNDEVGDDTIPGTRLALLTGVGISILHKPHGSSEKGRQHTLIADYEGTGHAFHPKMAENIANIVHQADAVGIMGLSLRDPDLSPYIMEELRKNRLSNQKVILQVNRGINPEQEGYLESLTKGGNDGEAVIITQTKGGVILQELASRRTGSYGQSLTDAEKETQNKEVQVKTDEILKDWAGKYIGKETLRRQQILFAILKGLQEADSSGEFEQQQMAGTQEYSLFEIFKQREQRYIDLERRGLLATWQRDFLIANLHNDNEEYAQAFELYGRLLQNQNGFGLSTDWWLLKLRAMDNPNEYFSNPLNFQEFMDAWRQQKLKLAIFVTMNELSLENSDLKLSEEQLLIRQKVTEVLHLFETVLESDRGKFVNGRLRDARRLISSVKEDKEYDNILTEFRTAANPIEYFENKIKTIRTTGGQGGNLMRALRICIIGVSFFASKRDAKTTPIYLNEADQLVKLLNLPETHALYRKLMNPKTRYLLLKSRWEYSEAAAEILKNQKKLLETSSVRNDKNTWLQLTDFIVQAIWMKAEFKIDDKVFAESMAIYEKALQWFGQVDRKLTDPEVQSFFFILMAFFDLRYLKDEMIGYDPQLLQLADKLEKISIARDGSKIIVEANLRTMRILADHQKAVQSGDLSAYQRAVTNYQASIDSEIQKKSASRILRQTLLLAQLNLDMAIREEDLITSDGQQGALLVHQQAREGYLRVAREVLKTLDSYVQENIDDPRLKIKLQRLKTFMDPARASIRDAAMKSITPRLSNASANDRKGGIDLNPVNQNLIIEGKEDSLSMKQWENLDQAQISGFSPEVVRIEPARDLYKLLELNNL